MLRGALLFEEVQYFRQNAIVPLVGIALLVVLGGTGLAAACLAPNNPGTWIGMSVLLLVGFLLGLGNLRVEVRDDALYARVFPLTKRHRFAYADLASCEAVTYRPLLDYGGWGVRFSRAGKAYNVYGNRGVQLEFKGGKRLLLGSQQPEQLAQAIQSRLPS